MLNKSQQIKWLISKGLVEYPQALSTMDSLFQRARGETTSGETTGAIWLLEHPPLWTAGISAKPDEVKSAALPVYPAKRGGKMTYHGPGQRVVYLMLDIRTTPAGSDVRAFVRLLEEWLIATLADFSITASRAPAGDSDAIGIWVGDAKIAALGVRLRHWVSTHGVAININPDLSHYEGIVPCGLDRPITSLAALGHNITMEEFDRALQANFLRLFQIPLANLQTQHFDPAQPKSF